MEKMKTNRVLNGSTGEVWLNDAKLAQISSVKVSVEGDFEEFSVCGDYRTFWDYKGYKVNGTMKMYKVNSRVLTLLKDAYRTGVMPEIKIITKLHDMQTGQNERAALTDIALTKFDIASFDAKTLCEEEIPFQAVEYEVLEEIV